MDESPLGARMHSFGLVLRSSPNNPGPFSILEWIDFLRKVAEAIGMSPVDDPAVWNYPVNGKGGTGQTIVLPITESFIALDTWPDHRGAYLFICSCREFDRDRVAAIAEWHALRPDGDRFYAELNLK